MSQTLFRRTSLRCLVVLAVAASIAYSPTPAWACPPFERYEEYFNYCPDGDLIGTIDRLCGSCATITTGTTNGRYRIDHFIWCEDQTEYLTYYYGRCSTNDPWTQLSGPNDCPSC